MTEQRSELQPRSPSPFGIVTGATYPFRALGVLQQHPKLLGYVLVPILVNLVVGGTLYAGMLFGGFELVETIAGNLPHWIPNLPAEWLTNWPTWAVTILNWGVTVLDWVAVALSWVFYAVLVVLLLLVTGYILLQFGVILGSPWYGKLSEELEHIKTGQLPPAEGGIGAALRDVGRAVLYELKKILIIIAIGIPLLLLNFLPGIGTVIATVGGVALGTTLVCLDFLDPALERRRLRFRDKLGMLRKSLPASASFGLVCFGLASIPLLNLLAIPICVAAGTLFFCDRVLPQINKGHHSTP